MKTFLSTTQTLFTTALLFLGLHTALFASEAEEFPFIGLNLSYDTITFNDLNQSIPSDDKTSFGLHLGKQTQDGVQCLPSQATVTTKVSHSKSIKYS